MNLKNCIPVLFVKDAGKSKNFYADILGMTVTSDFGGLNYTFKEGLAVWQIMEENVIPQTLGMGNITDPDATSRFELAFETDDIDNVYETLKKNNAKFLHEMNTELWGQRTLRFYDPDGHLIEIGEAMPVFLKRIFEEEGGDYETTARRTYMTADMLKQFLSE